MPVPPLEQIEQLGRELINANDLSVETCDKILGGICMSKIVADHTATIGVIPIWYSISTIPTISLYLVMKIFSCYNVRIM
jgi:hypothetical protein